VDQRRDLPGLGGVVLGGVEAVIPGRRLDQLLPDGMR
jgi:hypothetical protein